MSTPKAAAYLFAGALILRLAYIYEIADNPFFTSPVVDAFTYSQQAAAIAGGAWLDYAPGPFWQPPLYPWLLGAIHWLAGDGFFLAARLLQAALGALSCALLFLLGNQWFGRRVGLVASAALAAYGPAIYFDAELLPAVVATPLLLGVLLLVTTACQRPGWHWWLGSGLLLGLAAINVPTILVLAPVLLVWIWWHDDPPRRRARCCLLLLAGLGAAILPVTARNYLVGGDLVLISWNGGVNFFVGNNADQAATTGARPGQAWLELVAEAREAGYRNGSENSSYFYGRALRFIVDDPLRYAALVAEKTGQFWSGDEIGRNRNIYFQRNYSALLALALWKQGVAFPFGIVSPLALAGIVLVVLRRPRQRLPAAAALAYATGVILFFVTARYRMPVLPLLLLLAAAAVLWLIDEARRRPLRATTFAVPVLLGGVWANAGSGPMVMEPDAETYYSLGHAHVEKGDLWSGIQALQRAAKLAPEDAEILVSLGTAHAMTGNNKRAVAVLARGAAFFPDRLDIRFNLGNAYFALGRYEAAADEYAAALMVAPEPRRPNVLRLLGRSLARAGRFARAVEPYSELAVLKPQELEPRLALGSLHGRLGRADSSMHQYGEALRLDPGHPTALLEAGLLLLERGELDEAIALVQRSASRQPSPRAHAILGSVHEERREWGKAIAAYRAALRLDPDYEEVKNRLAAVYEMADGAGSE